MKKDGTRYLAELIQNGNFRWEIIHWGEAAMITPKKETWCIQCGLGCKFDAINRFVELDQAVTKIASEGLFCVATT